MLLAEHAVFVTPMNNHCTCGVEDCNRLLRYRIEMLREISSTMRAGEEAREGMKFKGKEACYDPGNQADLFNLRFRKRIDSPITLRRIGMTAEQVTMAWGKPSKINHSVGSWGIYEQWVYGSNYFYFEGAVLKSYQDSR
jgi:hypothetical protein